MDTLFWSREDGRYHVKINKLEQGNTLERMKKQRKIKCGNIQHTLKARRRKGRKNAPGSPFHTCFKGATDCDAKLSSGCHQ